MSVCILLVDDSPEILELLTLSYHARDDVRVVGKARNYDDAVKLLGSTVVDVISIDVHMGQFTGFDLCRTVRRARPDVFITMCSGDASFAAKQLAESCGAHYYLEKPIDFERIDRMLQVYNDWITVPSRAQG